MMRSPFKLSVPLGQGLGAKFLRKEGGNYSRYFYLPYQEHFQAATHTLREGRLIPVVSPVQPCTIPVLTKWRFTKWNHSFVGAYWSISSLPKGTHPIRHATHKQAICTFHPHIHSEALGSAEAYPGMGQKNTGMRGVRRTQMHQNLKWHGTHLKQNCLYRLAEVRFHPFSLQINQHLGFNSKLSELDLMLLN